MAAGYTLEKPPIYKNTFNTERAIGTWIDGKTIYEKTFQYTITTADTETHNISLMSVSDKIVINARGICGPASNAPLNSYMLVPTTFGVDGVNINFLSKGGGI